MANYGSAKRSNVFPYISVSGSAKVHARCAGGKITFSSNLVPTAHVLFGQHQDTWALGTRLAITGFSM